MADALPLGGGGPAEEREGDVTEIVTAKSQQKAKAAAAAAAKAAAAAEKAALKAAKAAEKAEKAEKPSTRVDWSKNPLYDEVLCVLRSDKQCESIIRASPSPAHLSFSCTASCAVNA